ncbi:MAG TPA: hypothetical protein VER58_08855 [Thermoanaerobaculia bacterium]|nr:hypothetical protein [Thermoanaerobaculia bacterium]
MKRMILLVSLLASAGFAADMPKPDLFLIHEEIVKPGAVMAYEAASKDFIAALAEKKLMSSALNWNAYMRDDFHYYYIFSIANLAALDSSQIEWDKAKAAIGADRWAALERRGADATVSYNEFVTMRRPDLSYVPANPRLKAEEQKFVRLDFYYLVPGKQAEAEAIAKDYIALFKAKNITEPFTIYMDVTGNDLPLLVAGIPAKSASDQSAAEERVNSILGSDVLPLQARAMAITRRFDRRTVVYRPDLSRMVTAALK